MVSSGQTTKTRQKTHVEFNAFQVSAPASELLGLGLNPRKGVVVEDDCHTGFLQCLQPALLNVMSSAGDYMHDLKRDRETYEVENTAARVEFGLAINETLNDPVPELSNGLS